MEAYLPGHNVLAVLQALQDHLQGALVIGHRQGCSRICGLDADQLLLLRCLQKEGHLTGADPNCPNLMLRVLQAAGLD